MNTDPADELTRLRAENAELARERDVESGRWQDAIRDKLIDITGIDSSQIDGAGCDSGDPLDVTLSEVCQGVNHVADERDSLRAQLTTSCKDWAEDDTIIKAICARFGIPDNDAPGYHKSCVECVEELAAKLATITAERDELKERIETEITRGESWCREFIAKKKEVIALAAAAVVKDGVLERIIPSWPDNPGTADGAACCEISYGDVRAARAALSPDAANPLLADLQAAAVALEMARESYELAELTVDNPTYDAIIEALARLARWITPAIEQKP